MMNRFSKTLGIVCAMALCLLACPGFAQEYEEQPLGKDQTGKDIRSWTLLRSSNESKAVVDMLGNNASVDNAAIDKFFNTMVFPLFTQWKDVPVPGGKKISPLVDSPQVYSPAKMRTAFKADYLSKAQNAAIHEHLNQLVMAAMEKIANGNYHPVCRNAAIMLIGDLNESDPSGPPYKKALPVLLKAATAANTIPHIRLAAWREILRHAAAGIDAENRPAVSSAALAALKQHTVPEGRSPIDHDWTCRRAIDVLAAIGEPGNGGAVVSAVIGRH